MQVVSRCLPPLNLASAESFVLRRWDSNPRAPDSQTEALRPRLCMTTLFYKSFFHQNSLGIICIYLNLQCLLYYSSKGTCL